MRDWIAEGVAKNRELERRRQEHDKAEADRRELRRIEGERAGLEEFIRRRGNAFVESAGRPPSQAVIDGWAKEFVDRKASGQEAERERLIDRQRVF